MRKSHAVIDHPEKGAVVTVLIEHGRLYHGVEATIDNGAARSLLPYSAVAALGLEGTLGRPHLVEVVGGGRVKAWRTKATLNAQIATYAEGESTYIGPQIALDPWFVKPRRRRFRNPGPEPRTLAGRTDFLDKFDYTKANGMLTLEWEE